MRNSAHPNALIYCQHLWGVGHVARTFKLVAGLQNRWNCQVLLGGPKVERFEKSEFAECVHLTPLLMNEKGALYNPEGLVTDEAFTSRLNQFRDSIRGQRYKVFLIELFPFGRRQFRFEIQEMIKLVRQQCPDVKVVSLVRDILVQKPDQNKFESWVVETCNEFVDEIFVHSDENWVPLDLTFSRVSDLTAKVIYTGYVADLPSPSMPAKLSLKAIEGAPVKAPTTTTKTITVSHGGGHSGHDLMRSVAEVVSDFEDCHFDFFLGKYAPQYLIDELQAKLTGQNAKVHCFSSRFFESMCRSELSISLGGYNTFMDVLAAQCKALVFPFMGDSEQRLRLQAFSENSNIACLQQNELVPDLLSKKIQWMLNRQYKPIAVNLNGVDSFANTLDARL